MIKLGFQAVDNCVEVVEIVGAQRVEAVENLVEVVDNSLYQNLLLKLWKPERSLKALETPGPFREENGAEIGNNTKCIALGGTGPDMINYTRRMTDGSGGLRGVQRR